MSKKRDLSALFPGTKVPIEGTTESVTVYPIGIGHIEKYADALAGVMTDVVIAGLKYANDKQMKPTDPELLKRLGPIIAGAALQHLLDLVQETVDVDLRSLPHWAVAKVVDCWVQENILKDDRIHPWIQMVSRIVEQTFGSSGTILEMLSKYSSSVATPDTTSLNINNPDSPTEDGPFSNLDIGLSEASPLQSNDEP